LVVGNLWNMGLVMLNAKLIAPLPEGVDMMDPAQAEAIQAWIQGLPVHAFLVVLVAHAGQAALGGGLAARLGASHPQVLAWIIGGLTLAGAAYNQVALNGPAWMWIDLPLIAAATWFVAQLEVKRRAG